MLGDIEADNPAAVVSQDEHHEQHPEVAEGTTNISMAAMSGAWLRRKLRQVGDGKCDRRSIYGYGRLTDLDTELEQLTVDAGRAPERIDQTHFADLFASLASYRPSTRARAPTPVEPKALPVPLDHGGRLHENDRFEATRPDTVEPDLHQTIDGAQPQTAATLTLEDRNLMT